MDYISSVITLQIKNKAEQKTVPGKVPVYSMTLNSQFLWAEVDLGK